MITSTSSIRTWRKSVALAILCAFAAVSSAFAEDPNPPTLHSESGAWPIHRQWTIPETRHFAEWIANIYRVKTEGTLPQRLAKLEGVLTDPETNLLLDPAFLGEGGNPQMDLGTIRSLHGVVDCAKLTVILSTYYSYRRALPWMIGYVRACDGGDVRTADYTIPGGCSSSLDYASVHDFIQDAVKGTCTGNFRVELNRKNAGLSDTAPVAIDRERLLPGCLYYLDGHVLILAAIDKYGEPKFLDSTTASLREIYSHNGLNAVTGITPKRSDAPGAEYSGCFRGFRVHRYPIAETDSNGNVKRIRRRTDAEMAEFGFSTEQYDKMEELNRSRKLSVEGVEVDNFHQYIRMRLRSVKTVDIAADARESARRMLEMLNEREQIVQAGWKDAREHGPIQFPEDRKTESVFNASGRWGQFSTAGLDADIRAQYFWLVSCLDLAAQSFDRSIADVEIEELNKNAIWTRGDYAIALKRFKDRLFAENTFTIKNSKGEPIKLSLLDVEQRLFDLSFDPNHPPEVRWGATPGSDAAKNAPQMSTPSSDKSALPMEETFKREAYYRSLLQRDNDSSYLHGMFTEGFSLRDKFNESVDKNLMAQSETSPPLVPHGGKLAWIKTTTN
jgi:hypothetical protein